MTRFVVCSQNGIAFCGPFSDSEKAMEWAIAYTKTMLYGVCTVKAIEYKEKGE